MARRNDNNGYDQWEVQFNKQVIWTVNTTKEAIQEAALALFDRIVERTPVGDPTTWTPSYWPPGYVPGLLKWAWQIKFEEGMITIWNDEIYARRIENGWSKQAPQGMMRVSLLEWHRFLDEAIRRRQAWTKFT